MQLTCTQAKNEATNKSTITWTLSSVGSEDKYYATGPTTVTINGTQVFYKARVPWYDRVFPAAKGSTSGTMTIDHNDNGSKTIAVSMSTVIYYGSGSLKTYSGDWQLDTIPRGAKVTSAPSTFSNTSLPTIKYTNPSGNSAATLEVCIADSAGQHVYASYRALSKTGTSYAFTATDMVALNNKVASGSKTLGVMFFIHTKTADGKDYYDGWSSTYQMVETTDTEPKVTMTLAVSNPSSVPSALANTYIQGKSKVTATITASGKYGATISSYSLNVGGASKKATTNVITSDAITASGTVSVKGEAVDSRGFTGSASQSITVLEYSKPLIEPIGGENSIQCYRSDGNGKRVGNSTSVWIKVKRSYHSLGGNNLCKLQWRRRLSKEAWNNNTHQWANLIARTDTATDEYNALANGEFLLNESYVIQIRAVDDFVEYSYNDFEIPTQDVALHLGKGGKNVSIGEYCDYSEEYTFRSTWKAKFDKGIYGTLTPQLATNVLTYATGCQIGTTPIYASADSGQLPPNGNFKGASGFVFKTTDTQITVVLFSNDTGSLAINIRNE